MTINLKDYRDNLIGGLFPPEEVDEICREMQQAKVGTIKAESWEKLEDDLYEIFEM